MTKTRTESETSNGGSYNHTCPADQSSSAYTSIEAIYTNPWNQTWATRGMVSIAVQINKSKTRCLPEFGRGKMEREKKKKTQTQKLILNWTTKLKKEEEDNTNPLRNTRISFISM